MNPARHASIEIGFLTKRTQFQQSGSRDQHTRTAECRRAISPHPTVTRNLWPARRIKAVKAAKFGLPAPIA